MFQKRLAFLICFGGCDYNYVHAMHTYHLIIIDFRKDANFIYNRITDQRILDLIAKMRQLFCPDL